MPDRLPEQIPTYLGRKLVRPDDELVDQGLGFDVVTLMGRRKLLKTLGLGAAALGFAACAADTTTAAGSTSSSSSGTSAAGSTSAGSATTSSSGGTLAEIPDETAGPYPGDGSNGPDVLEQSGIVRSDIRSSFGESSGTATGVPIELELTIVDLAHGGVPFAGAAVYVWHCDQAGLYSMYSQGATDQNYLRGVQIADADGIVKFTSIFPACYSGRWPHIHFEVYPDESAITDVANTIATSQVALPQSACDTVYALAGYEASVRNLSQVTLASDNVFGEDGGVLQLATVSGNTTSGYRVALTAGVDTTTPTGGGGIPSRGGTGGPGSGGQGGKAPGSAPSTGTSA